VPHSADRLTSVHTAPTDALARSALAVVVVIIGT
jgi:hypothetical protein